MMNKENKKRDVLSLWKIALGAIFLFNPTVNIVDPLPDFIGCFFIVSGLFCFSHISEYGYTAKKNFIYLGITSVAKLLVCLILPSITDDTFSTLMAFSFSVVESIFFVSAFRAFFECISSLGMRFGNDNIFYIPHTQSRLRSIEKLKAAPVKNERAMEKREREIASLEKRSSLSSLEKLTFAAFFIRAISAILPTLPALSMVNVTYFPSSSVIDWNNYVGPIYVLAWAVCLATGIPWLKRFRRYIRGVVSEESFCKGVFEKFSTNILSDPLGLIASRMRGVMVAALFAIAFCVFVPINGINVLPNAISAAIMIGAFVLMYTYTPILSIAGSISSVLWGAVSVVSMYLQSGYREEYGAHLWSGDIFGAVNFGVVGAVKKFTPMVIFSVIEAVLFGAVMIIFCVALGRALKNHISMMPERISQKDKDPKRCMRCLIPVRITGALAILANGGLIFAMRYLPEAWLINVLIAGAFFCFSLRAYYRLDDNVYEILRRKF